MIRMELQEKYIKDNCTISRENIDLQKLDAVLDQAWENAAKTITLVKRATT